MKKEKNTQFYASVLLLKIVVVEKKKEVD